MSVHLTRSNHYAQTSFNTTSHWPQSFLSPPTTPRVMDDHLDYSSASPRIRKKGGRGPGKKDSKDKTGVSVRWEEAELTDRLINALHNNELWAGVFIATSTAEHSRAVIGMPKSDLQRDIARYLFADDPRFDLDDTRTIDLLGTSVKNKVNKIRKLYNECKDELGPNANSVFDDKDIPPDSDLGQTWARVREKLPQYVQVRDIMNRPVVSSQAGLDASGVGENSGSVGPSSGRFHGVRSVSTPFPMEPSPGLGYAESPMLSPMQGGSHSSRQPQPYIRYYPSAPQPAPPRPTYPQIPAYPLQLGNLTDPSTSSSHAQLYPGLGQQQPSMMGSHSQTPQQQPSALVQQNYPGQQRVIRSGTQVRQASLSPLELYAPEALPVHVQVPDSQDPRSPVNPLALEDQRPHSRSSTPDSRTPPPSPPLTQTLFQMFRALESRKRQREEDYVAVKRMKLEHKEMQRQREERERERWHDREMLRLKIQLERFKRDGIDPDSQLGAGDDYRGGGDGTGVGHGGVSALDPQPHPLPQQTSSAQTGQLESHERGTTGGGDQVEQQQQHDQHHSHSRLSGMEMGGHHSHQHLQSQQQQQQHPMHSGTESLGDAALDALTSLREGTGSSGLR